MEVRAYEAADYYDIKSWLDYRDPLTIDIDLDRLPSSGLIVPGIGCVFWRITDDLLLWLDCAASNPRAQLKERREAGMLMGACLFKIIKDCKIKQVFFLTRNAAIAEFYAPLINAKPIDHFMLYRADYDWS